MSNFSGQFSRKHSTQEQYADTLAWIVAFFTDN